MLRGKSRIEMAAKVEKNSHLLTMGKKHVYWSLFSCAFHHFLDVPQGP